MTEDSPNANTTSSQRGAKDALRRNSTSHFQKNSINLLEMSDISSKGSQHEPTHLPPTSASSFDPFDFKASTSGPSPPPVPLSSDPSIDPLGALMPHPPSVTSPQRPEGSGPSDPWAALVSKHNPHQATTSSLSSSKRPPLPPSVPSNSKDVDLFSLLHDRNEEPAASLSMPRSSSTTAPLPTPLYRPNDKGATSSNHDDDGLDDLLAFTSTQVAPRSRSASGAGGGASGSNRDMQSISPTAPGDPSVGSSIRHSESEGNLSSNEQQSKTAREAAKAAKQEVAAALADQQSQCQPRELLIYAIPLMKDRLVFLPVTAFEFGKDEEDDTEADPPAGPSSSSQGKEGLEEDRESPSGRPAVPVTTVIGRGIMTGLSSVQSTMSSWWSNMKDANPGTFKRHVHDTASSIIENLTAEERLMKNIPRHANKLIVYHPACINPIQVQEQLNTMTSTFCMRSMGKAAVAGTLLPVAVGIEILAVPGIGWYALYQLYKSSTATAGGLRLKSYLAHGGGEDIVRVNYAAEPKLDLFVERAALSPDGILTNDDVDDLCFDLKEPNLYHNLSELRKRYIARHVKAKSAKDGNADYALLPVNGDKI